MNHSLPYCYANLLHESFETVDSLLRCRIHSIHLIDSFVLSVCLCFAFFSDSFIFYCSCLQLSPFTCQLLIDIPLLGALCAVTSRAIRDQLVDFVSVLVLRWIPHLYLISLNHNLYVFCDGALMSKKSCTKTG